MTAVSREVLGECGNMSSPTVLFLLDRLRRREAPRPCVGLGIRPGPRGRGGGADSRESIRQRIFVQRDAKRRNCLQPVPAARHAGFLGGHVIGVEKALVKRPIADDRLEIRIDNVLRHGRVAANVPFRELVQIGRSALRPARSAGTDRIR